MFNKNEQEFQCFRIELHSFYIGLKNHITKLKKNSVTLMSICYFYFKNFRKFFQ